MQHEELGRYSPGLTVQVSHSVRLQTHQRRRRRVRPFLGPRIPRKHLKEGVKLANDPKIQPYTTRNSAWNRDLFDFRHGLRSAVRDGRSMTLNFDVVSQEVADEFMAWRSATIAAEFDNLLRGSKGLPRQGILLGRISRVLEELKNDFESVPTRESYASRIAEFESAYEAKSKALWEAERDELWRSENQAKTVPGPQSFQVMHQKGTKQLSQKSPRSRAHSVGSRTRLDLLPA
jgi:hypothetical protein